MRARAIQTHAITPGERDLFAILDRYVPELPERAVVAITSKIVAICEGRVRPMEGIDKHALIAEEAERYLPPDPRYGVSLTLKRGLLIATAGIDESNSDGYYVLWPADVQRSAHALRAHLAARHGRAELGVIITDSRSAPLRPGVTGVALAHSGFHALNDYVGKPDLFGRPLRMTKVNVMDALAASAVLVMGEGSECTPLAVLEELPFVTFRAQSPSPEELARLRIAPEDDLYAPLLTRVDWRRGSS
jgi:dihydrofolate synthase / folylpolyglutamate synthase